MLSPWKSFYTGISQKWVFAIMTFFGLWLGNGLRVSLAITITEMVVKVEEATEYADDSCGGLTRQATANATRLETGEKYDWDEYTQGIILSSYFWGYAVTQFPFGTLSERFGGKYFLGLGILVPSLLTLLTPFCITWGGAPALMVLRVLMGVGSGAIYPSASTMVSRWTTSVERARIGSIVFAGGILGTVFGTTVPALIIKYSGMGWPAVFYFFGLTGMLWFPMWVLLCYNAPEVHPFITSVELNYLRSGVPTRKDAKLPPAPWKSILTSKQFWAFVIALVGCDWAYFTMASDLPKYMSSVIKFSIEDNGYLSSLPYLCMWISSVMSSWISDTIIEKGWLSVTNTRKFLSTIALSVSASFILAASYAGCDGMIVVVMFIIGMTLMGCCYPSLMINALDLSPNYSGTLMSIGNGMAAVGGILTPYIVGLLTPNQTRGEWRIVFWIVFSIALLANLYFLVFATAKVQEWDDPNSMANGRKMKDKSVDDVEGSRY